MLPGQFTHKGTLSNGREADEPNTRNARPGHIESSCQESELCFLFKPSMDLTASTATARLWRKKLPLEFGKLSLQLTQMVARSLVLLSLGHLGLDILDLWCATLSVKGLAFSREQHAPYPQWSPFWVTAAIEYSSTIDWKWVQKFEESGV